MSQQHNGFFSDDFMLDFMPGTAYHSPATPQTNVPIVLGQFGPYRSVSAVPDSSKRLSIGQSTPRQPSIHRSVHGTVNQYSQNWPADTSQYRSGPARSTQHPNQRPNSQYTGATGLQPGQPTRSPLPINATRNGQYSQRPHPRRPGTNMLQQPLPPRSVAQPPSSYVPPQNLIPQGRPCHPSRPVPYPTQSPQPSQSPQPGQPFSLHSINANQLKLSHQQMSSPIQRTITIPRPRATDWTTYRIDREGKRLPKTKPPPQGTYKVSEGIDKTDYSDPRDFFAPTKKEQNDVWNALKPTRETFYDLTHTELAMDEMRCLSMGYNASWEEIKRKFVEWIFERFSLDRPTASGTTTTIHYVSCEIPGYSREELRTTMRQQHSPKEINYFANGELAVNVEELLLKLDRWYGLIEDHQFSPTWPYERARNAGGYLVQNRDCFACMHCRMNQILCHGFREDENRKCAPCAKEGLRCSNEDF